MRALLGAAVAATATLAASPALAGICDSLYLDDDAQDVIIGEAGYESCFGGPEPGCFFMPYLARQAGVCWRDSGGSWHMEILSCDIDSLASDIFYLKTGGGDDRVAVLRDEHTQGYLNLLPAGAGTGAMYCGSSGDAVAPWHPSFAFQTYAYLGAGTDLFQGSDNRDAVWTNDLAYVGGSWTSPADGSSVDMVCTHGGNDTIYGDGDDDYLSGVEDWMDGGDGGDLCEGDYGVDGDDISDVYRNCEPGYDAYHDSGGYYIDCSASDDPLHEW